MLENVNVPIIVLDQRPVRMTWAGEQPGIELLDSCQPQFCCGRVAAAFSVIGWNAGGGGGGGGWGGGAAGGGRPRGPVGPALGPDAPDGADEPGAPPTTGLALRVAVTPGEDAAGMSSP